MIHISAFEDLCRRRFFEDDLNAAEIVDATLGRTSGSGRALFQDVLRKVRQEAHAHRQDKNREKLLALARERKLRMSVREFLAKYRRSVGTQAFLKGICAWVYAQIRSEDRVVWIPNLLVFSESAPDPFARDAMAMVHTLTAGEAPVVDQAMNDQWPLVLAPFSNIALVWIFLCFPFRMQRSVRQSIGEYVDMDANGDVMPLLGAGAPGTDEELPVVDANSSPLEGSVAIDLGESLKLERWQTFVGHGQLASTNLRRPRQSRWQRVLVYVLRVLRVL